MDKQFDFVCCWTCRHCVFDMITGEYHCLRVPDKPCFDKYNANKPTDCKKWER